MRAILVDDERLSLHYFGNLLTTFKEIHLIGSYSNSLEGLAQIIEQKPDVVFLDIEMPEMNGIELAEQLERHSLQTKIVFVTAFNEYAVQAFELNAIDYLVKPVQKERLHKTIHRLQQRMIQLPQQQTDNEHQTVCLFQTLRFKKANGEELVAKWRTTKVRNIFLFLLHNRGTIVRKDLLLELLWPETEPAKGFVQLYSSIYQVRKTLSTLNSDIEIVNHEDGYMLDCHSTQIDVDLWEEGIENLPIVSASTISAHQQLLSLYKGDYLEEFSFIWATSEKERLRMLWMQHLSKIATYYEQRRLYDELILLYLRVQEIDPYTEQHYFSLMQYYKKVGDYRSMEMQYVNLQKMMQREYNEKPNPTIKEWFQKQLSERSEFYPL